MLPAHRHLDRDLVLSPREHGITQGPTIRRALRRHCVAGGVLAAVAALGAAWTTPAGAAEFGSIAIAPARAEGTSHPGQRIGPITITNGTGRRYDVDVYPVLVGQNVDGGLYVRQDAEARTLAARLLRPDGRGSFVLRAGESRSIGFVLRRRSRAHNFYGGALFQATPREQASGSSIVQILQLNARVFLRPPLALQRPRAELTGIRGEQDGRQRIRLLAQFANTGNVDLRPKATVRVLDESGDVRFRGSVGGLDVLPGAEVELPVNLVHNVLPAGVYTVEASASSSGKRLYTREAIELFGPNELATRRAKLLTFAPPKTYAGETTEVEATYRNTGNVPFKPRFDLLVSGQRSAVVLESETVAPGAEGSVRGSVDFEGTHSRELTLRLLADGREVDTRTVSVTPAQRPSVSAHLHDWVLEHALLLVSGMAVLVAALMAALVTLVVRRA